MSIKCLYELDWRATQNLEKDFGRDYKEIIGSLGARGLYREEKNSYKLEYVGVISYKDKIIPVLPKFLKRDELKNKEELKILKTTIEVLKKYEKSSTEDSHSSSGANEMFLNSRLALVDALIKDYIEYGLYENHIDTYEINGDGEIDWENTMENEQVYLVKGVPLYLDLWTRETVSHDGDYIRRLHQYILNSCVDYLSNLEIQKVLGLIDVPNISFAVSEDGLDDSDYMIAMIERQLKSEFWDRNILLLKNMKKFLENDFEISNDDVNLWGTGTFHTVWEGMCKSIFKDEYNNYKDVIPYPIWKSRGSSYENKAKGTLIPDTLRTVDNKFFIFDAKYYNFYFNENGKIKGNIPGVGDVTKQFAYEMAFKNHFKETKEIHNYFVIPSIEGTKLVGKVEFKVFKELKPIKVLALNYNEVFKMYLENEEYNKEFFDEIL